LKDTNSFRTARIPVVRAKNDRPKKFILRRKLSENQ
jgi:hypothetical protein